jgi:hypothetical protein
MKVALLPRSRRMTGQVVTAGLLFASLLLPLRSFATLGGNLTTVETDQREMKATRAVRVTENYSVHEITTPYGTVVREFVAQNGTVFGVAWRGPFLPNLQQILGDYYGKYMQGAEQSRAEQPRRSHNAPLAVNQPDFVMHSTGHTRAYAGQAYIPGMIPQGVDAKKIR